MSMGLDLASELHWLAFRKRVCHVKRWKQTTGCALPEASKPAHLCTGEYGLSWYGVEGACQEDIHHATMWIGGHSHRKMKLHHRIQSNFLKSYRIQTTEPARVPNFCSRRRDAGDATLPHMTSVIDGDEEMSEVRRTTQMIVWSLSCHPSCGSIFPDNYAHHPLNYPLINSTAFVLAA